MHDVYHPAQTITLTANNLKKNPVQVACSRCQPKQLT
jgi:hypothetical protein